MVNRSYRKGYRFEVRVKKYLEERGYKVFRSAGSKPLDLIALSKDKIFFIECKVNVSRSMLRKSGEKLIQIAKGTPARPIIAYRDGNKIRFYDPINDIEYPIPYTDNLDRYSVDR